MPCVVVSYTIARFYRVPKGENPVRYLAKVLARNDYGGSIDAVAADDEQITNEAYHLEKDDGTIEPINPSWREEED